MALINTIAEIKNYLAIDANAKINTYMPFIQEAESLFLLDLIGQAFYDALNTSYQDAVQVVDDIANADHKAIFPYVQRCISYYAGFLSVNQIGVSFGDIGIQQQFGDNSQPAPAWKVGKLELHLIKQADIHAEKLLQYLENNASVSKFNEWYASTYNTKNEGYLVNSTRTASLYIDINDSRRLFLRLKKRIIDIEKSYIKKLICTDQYDDLVTNIKTDSVTAAQQNLIDVLRPIIAKKAMYLTLPSIRVSITDQGITVFSSNDGAIQKQLADAMTVKTLMKSLRDDEFGYISDEQNAKKYIEENIVSYPLIEASECWTLKPDPGPKYIPDNSESNKHFSV